MESKFIENISYVISFLSLAYLWLGKWQCQSDLGYYSHIDVVVLMVIFYFNHEKV